MAIPDLFSRRNAPPKSEPDVQQYDRLPKALRVQIVHIWKNALGPGTDMYIGEQSFSLGIWNEVLGAIASEKGVYQLAAGKGLAVARSYLDNDDLPIKDALDIIELTFRAIDIVVRENGTPRNRARSHMMQEPDDAIDELNERFLQHSVGYQYVEGQIVRVDSTYTHAEIVLLALALLSDARFANAEEEFLAAHLAYRNGRYKDCLSDSLKAFESTMKIICDLRGWSYLPTDGAAKLIGVVFANGLVAQPLQTQFNSMKSVLESGLPTARNKMSGHGQGSNAIAVPNYMASYGLNTCAANIALLVSAFNELS